MKIKFAVGLALLLAGWACSTPAWSAEPAGQPLTLKEAVAKALALSPEVREAKAALFFAEARRKEAQAYRWPQLEANLFGGPAPSARGDQVYSPDTSRDFYGIGPFVRLDILVTQPLYTFGRLAESIKAAQKGVEVELAGVDLKASEVAIKVKEYYYSLQMALEMQRLLDEAETMIGKSLTLTRKKLELETSSATDMDLYKLEAGQATVLSLKAEALKGVRLAQAALASVCGLDRPDPLPAEEYLRPVKIELKSLTEYKDQARAARPEMRQLRAGLEALESLVKAAEAEHLPVLYLAGLFSVAQAPDRTEIYNPFITDQFNHLYGGVAAGLLWKFNFGLTQAKIDQAKAERLKLKAKEAFAQMYLPLDVTQAFLEVKAQEERVTATQKGYQSARRWFLAASSNYDMGLVESKEVSDSLMAYATLRADYFKAVHGLNLGWAKLFKAAGLSGEED